MVTINDKADDGRDIMVLRDQLTGRTLAEVHWICCKPYKSLDEHEFCFVTPDNKSLHCKGGLKKLIRSKEILSFLGLPC